jgi:hypothetical protein
LSSATAFSTAGSAACVVNAPNESADINAPTIMANAKRIILYEMFCFVIESTFSAFIFEPP